MLPSFFPAVPRGRASSALKDSNRLHTWKCNSGDGFQKQNNKKRGPRKLPSIWLLFHQRGTRYGNCGIISELRQGFAAETSERLDCPIHQDIMTVDGFLRVVRTLIRIRPGGVAHWAPVCSSWVLINRGMSKRTEEALHQNTDAHSHVPMGALPLRFWILEQI